MIVNPIIPVWLMTIICIILIILILYKKGQKQRKIEKNNNSIKKNETAKKMFIINTVEKIIIVILIFIINLRIMIPNGESTVLNSSISVLFVIDKSVSMRALDYDGNKERFEGVVNDCCKIVDELSGCKFSIITFGDTAKRVIPFTTDSNMVQAELKAITLEDEYYAKGSSMNIVKEVFEKTLKDEMKLSGGYEKFMVFFISDGEITVEGAKLESFSNIKKYISGGAVMGYGTKSGGKMVNKLFGDNPNSLFYYLYYYDENNNKVIAVSKLDEKNLRNIASDLGIDYIQMSSSSSLDNKIEDIKKQVLESLTKEEKATNYQDTYYYFAILLVILLIGNFIIQKRRM